MLLGNVERLVRLPAVTRNNPARRIGRRQVRGCATRDERQSNERPDPHGNNNSATLGFRQFLYVH